MKDGLVERIRNYGHWRINFRPLSAPRERLLLGQCRDLVEKTSVSIRGWDFPNISRGNADEGQYSKPADYVENWTDWHGYSEFWRMYPSTQFIAYSVLREDTMPEDYGSPRKRIILFVNVIYYITEVIEFCHRLLNNGLYKDGVRVDISLNNTKGRILSAGHDRMPIYPAKETNAERIQTSKDLAPEQLAEAHREIAINFCVEIFDRFGWNPDATQLQAEQERFYRLV